MLLASAGISGQGNSNPLTPKESEVVRLLASGMSVTQVADYLHRSVKTISTQKKSAMVRLGLQSDSELFQYAKEHGFY
ncbi:LuxR C-terminal-related transcriptional regulator [Aeromonas veronii]